MFLFVQGFDCRAGVASVGKALVVLLLHCIHFLDRLTINFPESTCVPLPPSRRHNGSW